MRGIDASRRWYDRTVAPALEREFGELTRRIAVGLAGRGSECFGFDDEISRDHDFEVGLTLWLDDDAEREFGFKLERCYAKLHRELAPISQVQTQSLLGDTEHGVMTISDFYLRHLGFPGAPQNFRQWLYTPEYAFAEAVNGAVFRDDAGEFSRIRHTIATGMPEDVRCKKLAARAALMAQSGQYNFNRCLRHGERGAAHLALAEFVRQAGSMIFLLNRRFAPYYKWLFRSMRELPRLAELSESLEFLLTQDAADALLSEVVESVCGAVVSELKRQGLTDENADYLEVHAVAITRCIHSREIAALHLMEG